MNDLNDVRKRIRNRRTTYDTEEKKSSFSLFRLFYHLIMVVMCICVFVLALLLNQKMNWVTLPAYIEKLHLESIASWIPFDSWFSIDDKQVASTQNYQLINENQYTNGSNQARTLAAGVVGYIQSSENGIYTITIKQDNGVITTYGNLKDVQIKENERIVKDSVIGTYETFITMDFMKDNQTIRMDEAVLNED